jgi:hypothetical protein
MTFLTKVLGLTLVAAPAWGQMVVQNVTYSTANPTTVAGPNTIQAGTNVVAPSRSTVVYEAVSSIQLLPGFQAQNGCIFTATAYGPPAVPTGLVQTSAGNTSITIEWSLPIDPLVTGYHVYRNGTLIGSVSGSPLPTSYTDATASPDTMYSYSIVAYDAVGNNSAISVAVSALSLGGTNSQGYSTAVLMILKTNPNNTQIDSGNQMEVEVLHPN